jgi:hypothetical protein
MMAPTPEPPPLEIHVHVSSPPPQRVTVPVLALLAIVFWPVALFLFLVWADCHVFSDLGRDRDPCRCRAGVGRRPADRVAVARRRQRPGRHRSWRRAGHGPRHRRDERPRLLVVEPEGATRPQSPANTLTAVRTYP